MNALRSVLNDFRIVFNPKTRIGLIRIAVLVVAIILVALALFNEEDAPTQTAEAVRGIYVERVGAFGNGGSLSLIGTVEAIDQATLQSEVGGRVTGVRAQLGSRVSAGQVIATLENAAEYASVLQAEGAYEAALAQAAQNDIGVNQAETGVTQAENNAVSVVRAAYTAANSAIQNEIDVFFTSPDAQFTPGLRLEGFGYTSYLNDERVSFQTILRTWRNEVNTLDTNDNLRSALNDARERIERVIEMVDTFIILLNNQKNGTYSESELAAFRSTFGALRASLNGHLLAIENARTTLSNAEETLARARISGTGGNVSAADANVKQALGMLRAAQANYNRTVFRSPIAGVVQSLHVKTGDYLNAMSTVATVANADALLITTYVSANERDRFTIGDAVTLNGTAKGSVVAIAPAIDPGTGKIEVKIQSDDESLQNGDVVEISIDASTAETEQTNEPITIPITALKVETDRTVVFTVDENNVLIAHEITEGPILGSSIVIKEGITRDMEIVTDARGLTEGDKVDVLR